ncbi:MAG: flagellar basal body P-ring protein FlgI, partial [Kordiimonas sp.]
VAIAQGNLVISVSETPQVSQPGAFAQGGQTEVVPRSNIGVEESGTDRLAILPPTVTLKALVDGLNALEISPRDMIAILQALKAAGAMQAELQVM